MTRREKIVEETVETAALMAPSGEAVAHVVHDGERRALLVRGGAPEETLRASFDLAERPARAEILEVVRASHARVTPPCAFVKACGGCDWMHLTRNAQRAQHVALAESFARKATGVSIAFHPATRDLAYRTRARVHAREERGRMHVGFFGARSRELVLVDACIVLDARIDRARESLAALLSGAHGEGEVALALGKKIRSRTFDGRASSPRSSMVASNEPSAKDSSKDSRSRAASRAGPR